MEETKLQEIEEKSKSKVLVSKSGDVLPTWDLGDFYTSPSDPQIQSDLAILEKSAKDFKTLYQDKLDTLPAEELAQSIEAYEEIQEGLTRLMSYAQLLYATHRSDAKVAQFYQTLYEKGTEISTHLLFFTLELNRIDEEDLDKKYQDSKRLLRYKPWLRDTRALKPYQLDDKLESLLFDRNQTARMSWVRLFDETMAAMRFPLEGSEMTANEILNLFTSADRQVREKAGHVFAAGLKSQDRLFSLITNTLAKDKEIEDRWRGFTTPASSRHLANGVEREVVDALVAAVHVRYPDLSHRYYAWKAKRLGLEKLAYWDRSAPLSEKEQDYIPWEEATQLITKAFAAFSPKLGEMAGEFLDKSWIDAPVRAGKDGGAFSHPTVPSLHPYILMNYHGRPRDVMTLAHELGHGLHQQLAADQGLLLAETPLVLAETASVFGEMLTFQALLRQESEPQRRQILLAEKIEDMLGTIVRQIAFHDFETKVHERRKAGELLPGDIEDIWMKTQKDSLGPSFDLASEYSIYWSYVPHFLHVPFYVYAYAFGACLVNALYTTYERNEEGFESKYLDMLAAGGTKRHKALLEPFGLDAADPQFWHQGLDLVARMIDDLESLSNT